MVNKRDFFAYISEIYDEDYKYDDPYKTLTRIIIVTDEEKLHALKHITVMDKRQRLAYRHAMAANGKELTPRQVDQYITMIEYALSNMEAD